MNSKLFTCEEISAAINGKIIIWKHNKLDTLIITESSELAISTNNEKVDLKNTRNKTLVVDIDNVLAVDTPDVPLDERLLITDAQVSLKHLKEKGFKIVLHTSRFKSQKKETIEWLISNNIPFDDIIFEKPRGILYIDDRGYRFHSWRQFFDEVEI